MADPVKLPWDKVLLVALIAYGAVSLVHFTHNAVYVDDYPNLPDSLTSTRIILVWLAEAALGLFGYVFLHRGLPGAGFSMIAVYALFGFDGFAHYSRAPMADHTTMMNITIWAEALAAVGLRVVLLLRTHRNRRLQANVGAGSPGL
jgi:hypothetical protein